MPRTVRTARGVIIDFDVIILKQQLAQAPMNIEVARRKEFIDSKEGKARGVKLADPVDLADPATDATVQVEAIIQPPPVTVSEVEAAHSPKKKPKVK